MKKTLKKFLGNNDGSLGTMFGLTAIPIAMVFGVTVDVIRLDYATTRVQAIVDEAALVGAQLTSGTKAEQEMAAQLYLDEMLDRNLNYSFKLDPSITADKTARTVRVVLTGQVKTSLGGFLLTSAKGNELNFHTGAIAISRVGDDACLLSLNETQASAVNIFGNANVSLDGCTIMSNSSANGAINVGGNTTLNAECLVAVGTVTGEESNNVQTACSSVAVENASQAVDPYLGLAELTAPTGPCVNLVKTNPVTYILPNVRYCSLNLSNGNFHVKPGHIYVDGEVRINGNANVYSVNNADVKNGVGAGNMFFLKDGAITMNGNADIKLKPITSGEYSGMMFFSSRDFDGTHTFNGTSNVEMNGVLYAAGATIKVTGNFSNTNSQCMQIVANVVDFGGSSSFSSDCEAFGMTTIPGFKEVRLIE